MSYLIKTNGKSIVYSDDELERRRTRIARWTLDSRIYPLVRVTCPHCKAKNVHVDDGEFGYRECAQLRYRGGSPLSRLCDTKIRNVETKRWRMLKSRKL